MAQWRAYPRNFRSSFQLVALVFLCLVACDGSAAESTPGTPGEFGSDLEILKSFHTTLTAGQSGNHLFDMWSGATLARTMRHAGLTNNHALVINAHGKALRTAESQRYAYHPHISRIAPGKKRPCFSAADFATVLGRKTAAQVHNIVLAGCNKEGVFTTAELRNFFPNATNIIHMAAGEFGYQEMFRQIFFAESQNIQPAFQLRRVNGHSGKNYEIVNGPQAGATELKPYIAEIFDPSSRAPVRTQIAGRELLQPRSALRVAKSP